MEMETWTPRSLPARFRPRRKERPVRASRVGWGQVAVTAACVAVVTAVAVVQVSAPFPVGTAIEAVATTAARLTVTNQVPADAPVSHQRAPWPLTVDRAPDDSRTAAAAVAPKGPSPSSPDGAGTELDRFPSSCVGGLVCR